MNDMTIHRKSEATMSSREIAELTGKAHHSVLRDIRNMMVRLYLDDSQTVPLTNAALLFGKNKSTIHRHANNGKLSSAFDEMGRRQIPMADLVKLYGVPATATTELFYKDIQGLSSDLDSKGSRVTVYHLDRYHAEVLVTGYDVKRRGAVINRWMDLESRQQPYAAPAEYSLPTTFAEALRLAADQSEQLEQQRLHIEETKPDVDFSRQYGEANEEAGKGFRQVCKLLGAKENKFRDFLAAEQIMYRLNGEWMPYSHHKDTGRFVVKAGFNKHNGHAYNRALFTPKGVKWVAGRWAQYQLGGKA